MKSELKQAVSLERILKYWNALKEDGVKFDRVSMLVMEGMIYSLMDDEVSMQKGSRRDNQYPLLLIGTSSEVLRYSMRMKNLMLGVQGS